jgi:hypothetical protein
VPKQVHKPICRYISAGITCSDEYRALSIEGPTRLLFLFMLIHPHGGSFHVPGLYKVGPDTLRETSALPKKIFQKAFAELHEQGLARSDIRSQLVWVPSALHLMGPPANPNMVKGYCRSMQHMPKCPLLDDALIVYARFLAEIGPNFLSPLVEAFGDHLQTTRPGWEIPFRYGFETIGETYIHIDTHKNSDNHINDELEPQSAAGQPRIDDVLAQVGRDCDWPGLTQNAANEYLKDLPGLKRDEVKTAQLALSGRKGIRNPWSYFFAIIHRNRGVAGASGSKGDLRTADSGNFGGYSDGEEVTLHG